MTSVWKSSIFAQRERKEVYSKRKYHVNAGGGFGWVGWITVLTVGSSVGIDYPLLQLCRLVPDFLISYFILFLFAF